MNCLNDSHGPLARDFRDAEAGELEGYSVEKTLKSKDASGYEGKERGSERVHALRGRALRRGVVKCQGKTSDRREPKRTGGRAL